MQKVLVTFKNGYKMPGFRTPGNMIVYPLSFVCEVLSLDYNYWQRKGVTSGSTGNISWFTEIKLKDFLIGLSKNISKKSDKIQKEYNHIRIAFIQGIQDIKDIDPVKTENQNLEKDLKTVGDNLVDQKNLNIKLEKVIERQKELLLSFRDELKELNDTLNQKNEEIYLSKTVIDNYKQQLQTEEQNNIELKTKFELQKLELDKKLKTESEKVTELEKENRFLTELLQEWKAHHQTQLNGLRNFYMLEMKELDYNYKSLLEKVKKTLEVGNNDK
jgi:chromosome segregation ATPase